MTKNLSANILRSGAWGLIVLLASLLIVGGCQVDGADGTREQAQAQAVGEVHNFTFNARMTGYYGVGGDIDGQKNPVLKVKKGDKVTITIINEEMMAHDIALDKYDVKSDSVMKKGDRTSVTFVANESDTYYCTVPGHRLAGMVGQLEVVTDSPAAPALASHTGAVGAAGSVAPLGPAKKVDVKDISANASDIPGPIGKRAPKLVEFTLRTTEVVAEMEDGTTFEYWTFDDIVPGPLLRVREGDMVKITIVNPKESKMTHSIDLHSATGPGGGAVYTQVPPGEERTFTFRASHAGLFIYHCATPHIPTHLARGMYGMILVEPAGGLPKVDKEFYVMQGDFYTTHKPGTKGHQLQDDDRMFEESPTYVLYNGRVGALSGDRALKAEVGDTVRIFYGVGGPNLISSFHIIGEVFDRVYREADLISPPARSVQTTLVPAGGAVMVEFKVDYPGSYLLVDHALSRLDKGLVGILEVTGPVDDDVIFSESEAVPH